MFEIDKTGLRTYVYAVFSRGGNVNAGLFAAFSWFDTANSGLYAACSMFKTRKTRL